MIKKQQETVEDHVRTLLLTDPRCRNSDKWLLIRYWRDVCGLPIYIPYDKLEKWTPAESITRARRKIQETVSSLQPTSPEIRRKRGFKQRQFNELYGADRYYEKGHW